MAKKLALSKWCCLPALNHTTHKFSERGEALRHAAPAGFYFPHFLQAQARSQACRLGHGPAENSPSLRKHTEFSISVKTGRQRGAKCARSVTLLQLCSGDAAGGCQQSLSKYSPQMTQGQTCCNRLSQWKNPYFCHATRSLLQRQYERERETERMLQLVMQSTHKRRCQLVIKKSFSHFPLFM